jgi:hypothetical protein
VKRRWRRLRHTSQGVRRTFCAQCGTPLTYESETTQETVDVTTSSLDDPEVFPPNREVWVEHRITWEALDDRLPRYTRGSV